MASSRILRWAAVSAAFVTALLAGPKPATDKAGNARDGLSTNYNIPLWEPGKVPMAQGNGPLDSPFLTVFLPPEGKRNGASVVIAPGGSNIMLMYGAEGIDIAERYNDWGVTAFVLTYRMAPRYSQDARAMDGRRAIQLVRSRASEFHLDPQKVGIIGFSAGGGVVRSTVGTSGPGDANAADPVERMSSRPDYAALVYGPGKAPAGESLKDYPPTFLVAAEFDKGASLGTAQLFTELTKAGAVAEVHLYQKGRHGFGEGFGSPEFGEWMNALQHFLQVDGFLPGGKQ